MCSFIFFIIGIAAIVRGGFRIAERNIARPQARAIGILLMMPFGVGLLTGILLLPNLTLDGETINMAALEQAALIEFVALVIALAISARMIYQQPKTDQPLPRPQGDGPQVSIPRPEPRQHPLASDGLGASPAVPAAPKPGELPSIMTTAQAAAYLKISEPELIALIDAGKIGAVRSGSSYRIARIALDDYTAGA
jgi:excisionase family DNA binding protein